MVVEFSIVPIGRSVHLSKAIAEVIKIIESGGINYQLTPMGTILEGNWDQIMDIIKKCHHTALKKSRRVLTTIRIDDFPGRTGRMQGKVNSVKKQLKKLKGS
ncbi:MAG: MTH1187 family thiamine-binding protein [Candidatus Sumerlaeia bacterium]|nr:MTH1187 family thiamine-binding protein [Candidatus Sumerlaeia bacterium]